MEETADKCGTIWQGPIKRWDMSISLIVMDYSRPAQRIFELPPREGSIHSIFRRAMNIAIDDTMLTLLSSELPRMPNSIRLSSRRLEELLRGARPGLKVQVGDGRLLIPTCNFSLRLSEAPPWEPRPALAACRWHRETVAWHTLLLARHLDSRPQPGGLMPLLGPLLLGQREPDLPLARVALPRLLLLARASSRHDREGIEEATRGLAGLGPGLTPAGDDALAGFAAVMALLSPYISVDAAPGNSIAETIAISARTRTTALSASLLAHAARGEVAEYLGSLLLALALPTEASETVLFTADCLLAFGATSGGDTLLGTLLGLRVLEAGFDR